MKLYEYWLGLYPLDWEFCFMPVQTYKNFITEQYHKNPAFYNISAGSIEKVLAHIDAILSAAMEDWNKTTNHAALRCPPMIFPLPKGQESKVRQLMEYAGWQEGRKVDISIAEQYYADHGVPMMKTTQRFYRKYFGLCCEWYLEQRKLNWAADFQFALFPYLVNGIKNHLEEAYFRDMSGCELAEIEQAAGEKCQPIGHIGYYYPAEVWISECGKLYAKYEYQDEIECFPDVFALIERELRQCKLDSAAMKPVEALDGKL